MWTGSHFLLYAATFIIIAVVAFCVGKSLKDEEESIRMVPLKVVSVLLIIFETFKQIISLVKGYNLFHFPLHYCSLFLYLLPLFCFYNGKYKKAINSLTISTCMSLFLVMLIFPTSIYGVNVIQGFFEDYFDFQSVLFHFWVCLFFFLMISLRFIKFDFKEDIKWICIAIPLYLVIPAIASNLLDTNYHGMLYMIVDSIDSVRLSLIASIGGLGQAIYCLMVIIVSTVFSLISYVLFYKVYNVVGKRCKEWIRKIY